MRTELRFRRVVACRCQVGELHFWAFSQRSRFSPLPLIRPSPSRASPSSRRASRTHVNKKHHGVSSRLCPSRTERHDRRPRRRARRPSETSRLFLLGLQRHRDATECRVPIVPAPSRPCDVRPGSRRAVEAETCDTHYVALAAIAGPCDVKSPSPSVDSRLASEARATAKGFFASYFCRIALCPDLARSADPAAPPSPSLAPHSTVRLVVSEPVVSS